MDTTFYELIEVPATASEDTIKQALTQKQRFWSKRASNASSLVARQEAERKMGELGEARKVLLDPQARAAYDARLGGGGFVQPGPAPFTPQPSPVPSIWPPPAQPPAPPASRPAVMPRPLPARAGKVGTVLSILLAIWGAGLVIGYGLLKAGNPADRVGNTIIGVVLLAISFILLSRRMKRR
jgi:hypothetical protein